MKTYKLLLSVGMGIMMLTGCKDEAVENEDWCLDPSYSRPFVVNVDIQRDFKPFVTVDSVFKTRATDSGLILKYYVAAYRGHSPEPLKVSSSFDNNVQMALTPGKYDFVAWVNYESQTKGLGANFYTDDFTELLLRNKYNYSGASIAKIGYRGSKHYSIAYTTDSLTLSASPAMGQYRLIFTDTVAYKPAKVMVRYSSKIPAAIDGKDGTINWWWDDISFTSKPSGNVLASDFILSQPTQTSVTAVVEVYDENGYLRARKKDLEIPLINGGITTIRGNFLSILELDESTGDGAGISINTEWDSSFDIEI